MDTIADSRTLPPGHILGTYQIVGTLGRGGFGVTYLAHDANLDRRIAIKEYLPDQLATRRGDQSLCTSSSEHQELYEWGLTRFLQEARTLARFRHPNIVRVMTVFERHETAYMVMELENGKDFDELIYQQGFNDEHALKQLFAAIVDGLSEVHKHGFIHRDIKPNNIRIRNDNTPVLLDFGSARQAIGSRTQNLTAIVSAAYAPFEQYNPSTADQQGPWTDIYALGAVLYHAISGQPPLSSTHRGSALLNGNSDPLPRISDLANGLYSQDFLLAIDWALTFKSTDRPQCLSDWRSAFAGCAPTQETGDLHLLSKEVKNYPVVDWHRFASSLNSLNWSKWLTNSAGDDEPGNWRSDHDLQAVDSFTKWNQGPMRLPWVLVVGSFFIASLVVGVQQFSSHRNSLVNSRLLETGAGQHSTDAAQTMSTALPSTVLPQSGKPLPEAVAVQNEVLGPEISASVIETEANRSSIESSEEATPVAETQIEPTVDLTAQREADALLVAEIERELALQRELKADEIRRAELDQQQLLADRRGASSADAALEVEAEGLLMAVQTESQLPKITDFDMQQGLEQFNLLVEAIRTTDKGAVVDLAEISESREELMQYLFDEFESIEASLSDVIAQRTNQSIRANLKIQHMIRANGNIVLPSPLLSEIPIHIFRGDDGWSQILW